MITRRTFGIGIASVLLSPHQGIAATERTVTFADGTRVPALGLGSAMLGLGRRPAEEEQEAMRAGLALGMTVIDTAEVYSGGKSEALIGRAIADRRDGVFLVSKVQPAHLNATGFHDACAASLARLGTDHLDLYLLHQRGGLVDLQPIVEAFERLREDGLIRRWGVSNFGTADLDELFRVPGGDHCALNQVAYSLVDRQIERDLLPWCRAHRMPIMAYSPLGGQGAGILQNAVVQDISARRGISPAAVALSWAMRGGDAIAIPRTGSITPIRENAAALTLVLQSDDLRQLAQAFPM